MKSLRAKQCLNSVCSPARGDRGQAVEVLMAEQRLESVSIHATQVPSTLEGDFVGPPSANVINYYLPLWRYLAYVTSIHFLFTILYIHTNYKQF